MKKTFYASTLIFIMLSFVSCDTFIAKTIKKGAAEVTEKTVKEVAEKTAKEATESVTEKTVKELLEETGQKIIAETGERLPDILKKYPDLTIFYQHFTNRISKNFADDIIVNATENGVELVSKEFPNSTIRMNKNILIGRGGSLKNSGPMNEFLNTLLPNKTYLIDDAFVYKTDHMGRVVTCTCDRTKAYKTIERNTQRNSHIQKYIVENLDGKAGLDDAGHLFANNTGGPNELINQVPMSKELNRTGQWRQLEAIEERALKEGKEVFSQRNLLYRGNEKRPYAIEFIYTIDGVENRVLVDNIN